MTGLFKTQFALEFIVLEHSLVFYETEAKNFSEQVGAVLVQVQFSLD